MTRARRYGPGARCRSSQALRQARCRDRFELLDLLDRRAAARAQVVGLARHAQEGAARLLARQHLGDARRDRAASRAGRRRSSRSVIAAVTASTGRGTAAPGRLPSQPSRRLADQVEHLALRPFDLGQLDHGAGVILGLEIDEASALADLAAHADLEALRGQARHVGVEILRPVGDVLQAAVLRRRRSRGTSSARRCAAGSARPAAGRNWRARPR